MTQLSGAFCRHCRRKRAKTSSTSSSRKAVRRKPGRLGSGRRKAPSSASSMRIMSCARSPGLPRCASMPSGRVASGRTRRSTTGSRTTPPSRATLPSWVPTTPSVGGWVKQIGSITASPHLALAYANFLVALGCRPWGVMGLSSRGKLPGGTCQTPPPMPMSTGSSISIGQRGSSPAGSSASRPCGTGRVSRGGGT